MQKILLIGPLLLVAVLAAVLAPTFAGPLSTDGEALAASESPEAGAPIVVQPMAVDTVCRRSIGATRVLGKLVVPNGARCTLSNTTVLGSVEVMPGGVLSARGVNVGGELVSNGAASVGVAASPTRRSLIQGSVQLAKGRSASITGTTIDGGLQVLENANKLRGADVVVAGVRINDSVEAAKNTGGVAFNNNTIDENIEVAENAGGASVQSNIIGDNLTVAKNSGGTTVRSNRAGDNIDCVDNVPRPTGGGNVAGWPDRNGLKTGQCARL